MPDPIAALQTASAVIQLVDFASKLLLTGYTAYKSSEGATEENVHIQALTGSLKSLVERLAQEPDPASGAPSDDEVVIRELARRSQALGYKLIETLEKLKVKGKGLYRTWGAVRQTIKAVWKRDEIETLNRHLQELQSMVNTRLLSLIRNEQCSLFVELGKATASSASANRVLLRELSASKFDLVSAVEKEGHVLHMALNDFRTQTQTMHTESLARYGEALDTLSASLDRLAQHADSFDRSERILKSLQFPELFLRESRISDVQDGTYAWVFGQDSLFNEWLGNGAEVFFICGKAGSGKSTMVRFIVKHPRTRQVLEKWADGSRLVIASFFFWNSGSALQKTHEGLLQSLLYQLLRQCPSLIPTAAPERWNADRMSLSLPTPWERKELSAAIKLLMQHASPNIRFCFFVDGLDEYEGHPPALVKDLEWLTSSKAVKLCVSSRPRNAFADAYGYPTQRYQLVLHEHTRGDIEAYVQRALMSDAKFKALAQRDPNALSLVLTIQRRSSGVFLWVVLVVQELLEGLYDRDTTEQLRERLEYLPGQLEDMFERILSRIHPMHRARMARLLLVLTQAHESLPVPSACFLDDESSRSVAEGMPTIRPMDPAVFANLQAKTKDNVNKWCRDLIEVRPNYTYGGDSLRSGDCMTWDLIDFVHRSVRDYLRLAHVERWLFKLAGTDFDVSSTSCRMWFCWLRALDAKSALELGHIFTRYAFHDIAAQVMALARLVELYTSESPTALLDEVDAICTSHWVQRHGSATHWSSAMFSRYRPKWWEEHGSFLTLAANFGLELYLRQKLKDMPRLALVAVGPYLLDCASRKLYARPIWEVEERPYGDVVRLLKEYGITTRPPIDPDPTFTPYVPIWSAERTVVQPRAFH